MIKRIPKKTSDRLKQKKLESKILVKLIKLLIEKDILTKEDFKEIEEKL